MRYTTVIDISDDSTLYRNHNVVLLYLHMCLKCGYHDADRDVLRMSIRQRSAQLGMSVSAVRHALGVLQQHQLIARDGDAWRVKKWHMEPAPSPRPRKQQAKAAADAGNMGEQYNKEVEDDRQRVYAAVRACKADELRQWWQELSEGRSLKHHGVYINANQDNAAWLKKIVDRL